MKIIEVDEKGNEKLVCESIDEYHGNMVMKLLNGNWATKHRNVEYRLVPLDHVMNVRNPINENYGGKGFEQLVIDEYLT